MKTLRLIKDGETLAWVYMRGSRADAEKKMLEKLVTMLKAQLMEEGQ